MGKLESITTLATIAAGGLLFLKFYPMIEGFLKPGGGLGSFAGGGGTGLADFAGSLIPVFGEQPLRTYEPVLDVRPVLTEDTAEVPGVPGFQVSPQRLEYQEEIGVPIITSEQLDELKAVSQHVPIRQTPQATINVIPFPVSRPVAQQSGSYWVNPITQANIGTYISGQVPAAVERLRAQDIFPSIRGF